MNWDKIFFGGWNQLLRVLMVGTLAYVILILFLRVTGKRTLSKMNAFDMVVTVALGSTLATILLSKDVSLAEGAVALALLVGLQFLVTWTSVRIHWVRRLVTGEPACCFTKGSFFSEPSGVIELPKTKFVRPSVLRVLPPWRKWKRSFWKRTGRSA